MYIHRQIAFCATLSLFGIKVFQFKSVPWVDKVTELVVGTPL